MSRLPRKSPWGDVQTYEQLCKGVFKVSTASHGGIMVRAAATDFLSKEALKIGFKENNTFCFEEDNEADIVLRELLDKGLWKIPERITDMARYEDNLNQSIQHHFPEYWELRQKSITTSTQAALNGTEKLKPTLAERLEVGKAKAAVHNSPQAALETSRKPVGKTEL